MSTVDILGTLCVSNRRIATLSVACSLAETTLREHKEKLVEVLGEKNAQKVREAISKEKVTNNKTPEPTQIINTGGGDTLCYDEYSGRYFYSSPEKIGEAIVKLSYDIQSEMWVELNRLYVELGLKGVKMGDDLGWSVDHTDRGRIPVYYTAILTENNRPCIAMQFDVEVSPDMLYTS